MKQMLWLLCFTFCYTCVFCQTRTDSLPNPKKEEKKVELRVMPYLSYNRNLKAMVGAIPMMMYKLNGKDTVSPKSLSGMTGIYTTNNSYFVSLFNKWYFAEDRWRLKLFALTGNKNSQFFVDDIDVPDFYNYGTKTTVISVGVQRKIIKALYGGLSYTYAHYNTVYQDSIAPASTSHTNGLVLNLLYDTRNTVYYPTKGDKINVGWTTYPTWFGNAVEANKVSLEYDKYFPARANHDVFAARLLGKFGLGNISFEQQVTLGNNDIRGYSEGKYRGDGLMDIQGEYRFNFGKKMGLVGFAGLATIYGSDTPSFNWKLYPGVGVGYRYNAFKSSKFNVGLDGAVGKGDYGIYFRIGEAF
ncbi:BamA/TamA family outer membrane protein [Mucilaginibacter jinjuensis]|uniref:BamA/TamA family outer membrane protein n=1 Tax=Mucilaginibacter jinjuensis TaxID=1176721 RepID=A0ABY7T603_9SPHI|nr:BamA/TamA family outer membrane protein [Mucilaginibacter jinjuensis]WCT11909.1 BamA/TamA family outer membrane protein [Mucilaginibacter jinjuensis]